MFAAAQLVSLALDAAALGARVRAGQSVHIEDGSLGAWAQWAALALLVAASVLIAWRVRAIGPGSLRQGGGRGVFFRPSWYWLVAGVGVVFGREIGAALAMAAGDGLGFKPGSLPMTALVAAWGSAAAIGVGVLAVVAVRRGAPDAGRAGLRARLMDLPAGLLALLITLPLVQLAGVVGGLMHTLVAGEPPDAVAHATLTEIMKSRGDPWVWLLIFAATMLGPVVEELVFRVFLQSSLLRVTRSPWVAVVVTGALFALMHRAGPEPVPWHAVGSLFVLGVGLGAAYERTRRLGVPMVMHALFNAGNVAAALWWV